jgi:hypothetical protein
MAHYSFLDLVLLRLLVLFLGVLVDVDSSGVCEFFNDCIGVRFTFVRVVAFFVVGFVADVVVSSASGNSARCSASNA